MKITENHLHGPEAQYHKNMHLEAANGFLGYGPKIYLNVFQMQKLCPNINDMKSVSADISFGSNWDELNET